MDVFEMMKVVVFCWKSRKPVPIMAVMSLERVPIPDDWRLYYPHYIAAPEVLRSLFLFVISSALVTFIATCIYYYSFERELVTVIGYTADKGAGWSCASIGLYNGPYSFLSDKNALPTNLAQSTNTGLIKLWSDEYFSTQHMQYNKTIHYWKPATPTLYGDIYSRSWGEYRYVYVFDVPLTL